MQVDHAHGDVKKDLFNWGTWILKETGASGFRFDAVKQWVQELGSVYQCIAESAYLKASMLASSPSLSSTSVRLATTQTCSV